ncbi:phage tail tube protein [Rhizosaccharibacter radicis]|uniref:Phage tail tube protein n=1 Tax=Rhizosaccharibacter radicis TaxID=2782605 RepID=A0ABT1VVZ4_9PROT|nr:phage tail tube protein [Acetobacteraceae bacterium KSS12]
MSGTRQPLAGTASLTINGEPWNVVGDLSYRPSGPKNETLKGQTAVEGFQVMPEEGYISGTLRDRPDRKLSDFKGASGLTVTAQLANGKVVTCTNGWVTELGELKTQEGTFDLHIESDDVTEDTV